MGIGFTVSPNRNHRTAATLNTLKTRFGSGKNNLHKTENNTVTIIIISRRIFLRSIIQKAPKFSFNKMYH
jgi:hypothetical protein